MAATKPVRSPSPKLEKHANGVNGINGNGNGYSKLPVKRELSYKSDGVEDNDVFLLPVSDYQIMFGLTILAAIVRLFRIYQPTSVVFDEVQ